MYLGERVSLMWASANRDPAVVPEPDTFRPDRGPEVNSVRALSLHLAPP